MIYIDDQIKDYIINLVRATREPNKFKLQNVAELIDFGASPRASIFLGKGARAIAFLNGRGYVTPQDVKTIAPDVLRHRVILTYEAEAENVEVERRSLGAPESSRNAGGASRSPLGQASGASPRAARHAEPDEWLPSAGGDSSP